MFSHFANPHVSFDHCGNPRYYGVVKSADLEHWQDISPQASFPGRAAGAVSRVLESVVRTL
jgi:hypothetical protein